MEKPKRNMGAESIAERLRRHPELERQIEKLLDVVENLSGDINRADDAEEIIAEEMVKISRNALQGWAERKHEKIVKVSDERRDLSRREKKGSTGTRRLGGSG